MFVIELNLCLNMWIGMLGVFRLYYYYCQPRQNDFDLKFLFQVYESHQTVANMLRELQL